MEHMEYRAYYTLLKDEFELCKFWVTEEGDVDADNLPNKIDTARLLQALRLHDVQVEFTGKVDDDE